MTLNDRIRGLAKWLWLGTGVGALCGVGAAIFLWLLGEATTFRQTNVWMVYLLPFAGWGTGWVYARYGQNIKGGNNLVVATANLGTGQVPARMAPMVVVGTVVTHLFGGSAGREGTAVQMGASLASWFSSKLKLTGETRSQMFIAGISGGFGAVFGTPIAGAIFALEVAVIGRLGYRALIPALTSAVVGDVVARIFVGHAAYPVVAALPLSAGVLFKWLLFAGAVAATTAVFIRLTSFIKTASTKRIPHLSWRLFSGGIAVIGLFHLFGTPMYLGLGVDTILAAFHDETIPIAAFAIKLLFTAVTLGAGYLGGEVTPLFFVGATLGNVLARLLGLPLDMGAAVGLAAVFAAAANTPLSLSIMAVELLGANVLPHVFIVTSLAYVLTGNRSIYITQRIQETKTGQALDGNKIISDFSS